mmetsp:Transcript_67711/g.60855  ORF Transcript_67711/g.60855 Transcript_67711/m.60855 type:complete len:200 (-) Transcript_67711:583-1182(-)
MQTTTGSGGGGDPKGEYYRLSAEKCFCNDSCSCCTCHCCALCMMVMWVIFGSLGAYGAYTILDWTSDGTWVSASCTTTDGVFYDDCCIGSKGLWGSTAAVAIVGVDCSQVETVYTIQMVDNILSVIAGIVGIVGICGFIAFLLFVPLAYSVIAVILDFVVMATLGFDDPFSWIGIAISCLIVVLFYYNWKIMKDAMGMM